MKIKIEYNSRPNSELDFQFIKLLKSNNFIFEGSGYNFQKNKRDISFTKKGE